MEINPGLEYLKVHQTHALAFNKLLRGRGDCGPEKPGDSDNKRVTYEWLHLCGINVLIYSHVKQISTPHGK